MSEEQKDKSAEELMKKLFNEKEYKTIIVGADGVKNADSGADLLSVLIEDSTREEKDEALKILKEKNTPDVLIGGIQGMKSSEKKAKLIAACWETGIDFSNDLIFFVRLACSDDFKIAMEAFTVIENMENIKDKQVLENAKRLLKEKAASNPPTLSLLNDLMNHLDSIS